MHHLARHAVACFLTRGDLWLSWEQGAHLVCSIVTTIAGLTNACCWNFHEWTTRTYPELASKQVGTSSTSCCWMPFGPRLFVRRFGYAGGLIEVMRHQGLVLEQHELAGPIWCCSLVSALL